MVCKCANKFPGDIRTFLPRSAVDALIHEQSVEEYWLGLEGLQPRKPLSEVLDYVLGTRNARFVFVIIVLMGDSESSLLGDLMQDGVYDDDLPLSPVEVKGADSQFGRKLNTTEPTVPLACFRKWSPAQVNYFGKLQRQVKAEVLENWPIQLSVFEVPNHSVLPFMQCKRIHDGNSEVFRVEVHHAHHRFKDSTKGAPFALKVLEAKDELTFKLEVKALMKIRQNQHLVTAVTAFKYQNKYHLMFNWADGGTLADFWKRESPSLTHDSMCWLAQQCHGLADGLCGIHNAQISVQELADVDTQHELPHPEANAEPDDHDKIHGRHGDIKPDNILWFSDEENQYKLGVLKITDFGVTAFHNAKTTKVPAEHVPRTITYAAPEVEVSQEDDEPLVSRPFDIWSLGCVYLEFITWTLLDKKGVLEFEQRRMAEKVTRRRFEEDSFYSIHRRGRLNFWSRDYGTVKTSVVSVSTQVNQYSESRNLHLTPSGWTH
ncbi:kinase-like domain-containing protein [Diaporthe sp. PMI_573]|nr:kinase-like domain-containing protein [Diaporthaceae sp. PMI_573]